MKKWVILVLIGMSCNVFSQDLVKFESLQQTINQSEQDLTIVNFWATWCGPCIKELPYFEAVNKNPNIKVILVSLDFPEEAEKVRAFAKKKSLTCEWMILDEKDYDSYMGRISDDWSGAIPATLMIAKSGERKFFEKAFTKTELDKQINQLIN
jgi:thiol-disulfide isomerase/thioredoxin